MTTILGLREDVARFVTVQLRVRSRNAELVGGQHVVRLFSVQSRIGRGHPELLGRQHVVGGLAGRI